MINCNPPHPLTKVARKKIHYHCKFGLGPGPASCTRAAGSAPTPPTPQQLRGSTHLAKRCLHALLVLLHNSFLTAPPCEGDGSAAAPHSSADHPATASGRRLLPHGTGGSSKRKGTCASPQCPHGTGPEQICWALFPVPVLQLLCWDLN